MVKHLWLLPAIALVMPILVALVMVLDRTADLQIDIGLRLDFLLAGLGILSPVIGLFTFLILGVLRAFYPNSFQQASPRKVIVYSTLALISPIWLVVLFFIATGVNR
jgi:hypothetical protein